VELALAAAGGAPFVPNDVFLDGKEAAVLILTGPNMAGKSTYLRQTALAVILAQMGSFVPAESAEVGLADRVFTRIGAGDNLAAGASTFLVEMQEVSNILRNATPKSLVILDEVGRGTSTYDGVAVAWAVVEHLQRRPGPAVLFATHYYELTALADRLPGVKNFHVEAREWTRPDGKSELVFLRQVAPGPADRSYGVHVAEMAGLPPSCVDRARNILHTLEASGGGAAAAAAREAPVQGELFRSHPALDELSRLDINALTPLDALRILDRVVKTLHGEKEKT
jgi:DNA mismatch repair protein MutS